MSLVWIDPESRENRKPEAELPLFPPCTSEPEGVRREATMVADGVARKTYEPSANFAHARRTDPVHSHDAAASVVNIGPTKEGILQVLRLYGPSTDERIALMYRGLRAMGKQLPESSPSGLRSRRAWLVDHGFVCEGDTGKTAAGRNCTIWRIR